MNQPFILHTLPKRRRCPTFKGVEVKTYRSKLSDQSESFNYLGASIGQRGQLDLFVNASEKEVYAEEVLSLEFERQSVSKLAFICVFCKKAKPKIHRLIKHEDFLVTHETCSNTLCFERSSGPKLKRAHVVLARKTNNLQKTYTIYSKEGSKSESFELCSNKQGLLVFDQKSNGLAFFKWASIKKLKDEKDQLKPERSIALKLPVLNYFLDGQDIGYLTKENSATIPGMSYFKLPDHKKQGALLFTFLLKLSTTRVLALAASHSYDWGADFMVLLSNQGEKLAQLKDTAKGVVGYSPFNGDDYTFHPIFDKIVKVSTEIFMIACTKSFFHLVMVKNDKITMLKELERIGYQEHNCDLFFNWHPMKRVIFQLPGELAMVKITLK